jgi:hypothetical protein
MNCISRTLARLPLLVRLTLIVAIAVATSHVFAHDAAASVVHGIGAVTTAMIVIPWSPPYDSQQLYDLSNPQQANQPEVVPWQLFDTQSLATATSAPLVFFQTINADKTMSNMEGPGQLPDPQHLIVHYVALDILQVPTATVLANEPNGALANVENILKTCRATFEFNMSNKRYGPFSATMCHSTGGATFAGYGYGTAANGTSSGVVNNGIPGTGGYPFSGALVVPPKIGFDVTIRFGANVTLAPTPVLLRISLVGALYRRVL